VLFYITIVTQCRRLTWKLLCGYNICLWRKTSSSFHDVVTELDPTCLPSLTVVAVPLNRAPLGVYETGLVFLPLLKATQERNVWNHLIVPWILRTSWKRRPCSLQFRGHPRKRHSCSLQFQEHPRKRHCSSQFRGNVSKWHPCSLQFQGHPRNDILAACNFEDILETTSLQFAILRTPQKRCSCSLQCQSRKQDEFTGGPNQLSMKGGGTTPMLQQPKTASASCGRRKNEEQTARSCFPSEVTGMPHTRSLTSKQSLKWCFVSTRFSEIL
jgi:hypothetical protein